jgi:hypothetical protein
MLTEIQLSNKRLHKALRRKGMGWKRSMYLKHTYETAMNYAKMRRETLQSIQSLLNPKRQNFMQRVITSMKSMFRRNSK